MSVCNLTELGSNLNFHTSHCDSYKDIYIHVLRSVAKERDNKKTKLSTPKVAMKR